MNHNTRRGILFLVLLFTSSFAVLSYTLLPSTNAYRTIIQYPNPFVPCICGPQEVNFILVEFKDRAHEFPAQHYEAIVSELNSTIYQQSYKQTWLVTRVIGWVQLNKSISSYGYDLTQRNNTGMVSLIADAQNAAGPTYTTYEIFVFSGHVWPTLLFPRSLAYNKVGTVNEESDLGVYVRQFGGMVGNLPETYDYASQSLQRDPTAALDVMGSLSNSSSTITLSSWSRMKLGWIQPDSVHVVDVVSTSLLPTQPFSLPALDDPDSSVKTLMVIWHQQYQYELFERRADGIYAFHIDERNMTMTGSTSALQYKETLFRKGIIPAKAFVSLEHDYSVIPADQLADTLIVGTAAMGISANQALGQLRIVGEGIDTAYTSDRVQGLDQANATFQGAWQAFDALDFQRAEQLATMAKTQADSATVPQSYNESKALLSTLNYELTQYSTFSTPQAQNLRQEAAQAFSDAASAAKAKHFDEAKALAQRGLSLLGTATDAQNATVNSVIVQANLVEGGVRTQQWLYVSLLTAAVFVLGLVCVATYRLTHRADARPRRSKKSN